MLKKLITISITAIASLQAATTYNKSLTDGNDDLNYWSDTTSSNLTNHTLVGATEVFTIGSRKNIPNVPTPIKVSTNKLCSDDRKGLVSCSKSDFLEPRYTDDGLATSGENNLRTWYKATTPKSVNGVVDNPCTSLSNTGSVVNWAANFSSLRCERTITTYTPKVDSTVYANKIVSNILNSNITGQSTSGLHYSGCNSTMINYPAAIAYCTSVGGRLPLLNEVTSYTINMTSYIQYRGLADIPLNGVPHCKDNTYGGSGFTWTNSVAPPNGSSEPLIYGYGDWYWTYKIFTHVSVRSFGRTGNQAYTRCVFDNPYSSTSSTCPSGYTDNVSNCKKTVKVCPDASWSDNVTNCKKNVPEYKLFSTF